MNDGGQHRRRIVTPEELAAQQQPPLMQLQVLANGQILIHAPGLTYDKVMQLLLAAFIQTMVTAFQPREHLIDQPPEGWEPPRNGQV